MDNWSSGGYSFDTQTNTAPSPEAAAPVRAEPPAPDMDDEMAAFEAACARRLQEEHQRRAQEAKAAEIAKAAEAARAAAEQENARAAAREQAEPQPAVPEQTASENPSDSPPSPTSSEEELSALMREADEEQRRHDVDSPAPEEEEDESFEELEEYDDEDDELPDWLRLTFTVLLLLLGVGGMYIMVGMNYHSYLLDPLCFTEITVCMLTALGLNTSLMSSRLAQALMMRSAAFLLFLFYCLYSANDLFLHNLLASHFVLGDYLPYAGSHVSMALSEDLAHMGVVGMTECVVFVMPFAFLLLTVMKPFRHILFYFLGITLAFCAVAVLRLVSMSGSVSGAQWCMAMVGAAVAYVLFMLPPLQSLLRRTGLIAWAQPDDDE